MCEKMEAYQAKIDKRKTPDKRIDVLNRYFDEIIIPMGDRTRALLAKNPHIPTVVNTQKQAD